MRTGAGLWVRSEWRRRWRALVLVGVLSALLVTVVLTAVAGARRTTTAYDRFRSETRASHVDVQLFAGLRGQTDVDLGNGMTADEVITALRKLPEVKALNRAAALLLAPPGAEDFSIYVSLAGDAVDTLRVLEGRLPRGVGEVAISRSATGALANQVGDELTLVGYGPRQAERAFIEGDASAFEEEPDGPRVVLDVVGVVESAGDVGRVDLTGPYGVVTPEFYRRYGPEVAQFGPVARVRLDDGFRDLPTFMDRVRRLAGESESISIEEKRTDVDAINEALDVQALALLLFAAAAAAAGLVAVGTTLVRQLAATSADAMVLGALGLTRRQRAIALAATVAPAPAAGVVLGVLGAVAASPLLPLGLGRRAEPDPGPAVDGPVLLLAAIGLAAALAALAGYAAWRSSRTVAGARQRSGPARAGAVNRWISRLGLGAVGATGLRLALDRGPREAPVPTRTALTAAIVATASVAAALVFGASLTRIVEEPALSGFPWHAASTAGQSVDDVTEVIDTVVADPAVADVTAAFLAEMTLAGTRTQVLGTRAAKGSAGLTVVDGRAPSAEDEVAVGPQTLQRLGADIGDRIALPAEGGGSRRFRTVGTASFPVVNYTDYDNGVWLADDELEGLDVVPANAVIFARLTSVGDTAAKRQELEQMGFDFRLGIPARVANLAEVADFPRALAAFLALVGLASVGHALVSSSRRRRRDLAVLRSLGFLQGQMRAAVVIQATVVSAIGVAIGLPLGIATGRTVWGLVADGLSVVNQPVVPGTVVLVAAGAIVMANLLAIVPAHQAAAVRPAEILRAE